MPATEKRGRIGVGKGKACAVRGGGWRRALRGGVGRGGGGRRRRFQTPPSDVGICCCVKKERAHVEGIR